MKYHFSPQAGNWLECRAGVACPYGHETPEGQPDPETYAKIRDLNYRKHKQDGYFERRRQARNASNRRAKEHEHLRREAELMKQNPQHAAKLMEDRLYATQLPPLTPIQAKTRRELHLGQNLRKIEAAPFVSSAMKSLEDHPDKTSVSFGGFRMDAVRTQKEADTLATGHPVLARLIGAFTSLFSRKTPIYLVRDGRPHRTRPDQPRAMIFKRNDDGSLRLLGAWWSDKLSRIATRDEDIIDYEQQQRDADKAQEAEIAATLADIEAKAS